jgi:hypothetical protein
MFEKEELVLIHRAIAEWSIKGSDAHVVSKLLNKIVSNHTTSVSPEAPSKPKIGTDVK